MIEPGVKWFSTNKICDLESGKKAISINIKNPDAINIKSFFDPWDGKRIKVLFKVNPMKKKGMQVRQVPMYRKLGISSLDHK